MFHYVLYKIWHGAYFVYHNYVCQNRESRDRGSKKACTEQQSPRQKALEDPDQRGV